MPSDINYLAVFAAAVVSQIIGMLWYSPKVFGTDWMKGNKLNQRQMAAAHKKGMGTAYLVNFLALILTSYILAHFVNYVQATNLAASTQLGFWLWAGFVVPLFLGSILWERKPVKLYLINVGYQLVSLVVMAAILVSWV